MRSIARNLLLALSVFLVLLLALGALPQYLGGGEVYRLTATEIEPDEKQATVDVTNVGEHRYPYLIEAIETGQSVPYEADTIGIKEWFTHTPMDELGALSARNPEAVERETAYVVRNETVYRVELERVDDDR